MKKIMTPEFRVSFPAVFTPTAWDNNLKKFIFPEPGTPEYKKAKYSVTMLFSKDTDISDLKALAKEAIEEKWGVDSAKWPKDLKNPFKDGDIEKPDIPGYENSIYAVAGMKAQTLTGKTQKPGVVDRNRNPITEESEFYAGCYARMTLIAYAYSHGSNHGVGFGIQNIQMLRDGEPFSGRSSAANDFGSDSPKTDNAVEDMFS